MKKATFKKNNATLFEKIEGYFFDYLTDIVITCAFLFILVR